MQNVHLPHESPRLVTPVRSSRFSRSFPFFELSKINLREQPNQPGPVPQQRI